MLNKITIHTELLDTGGYFLTAYTEEGVLLHPKEYSKQLFAWDEVSFHGSFLEYATIDHREGIKLRGSGLMSLFSQENFLSFIQWEWDDLSSLCLSTAPAIKEAIEDDIPVPDFAGLLENRLPWGLPASILGEFDTAHWNSEIPDSSLTTYHFVEKWYNDSISEKLDRSPDSRAKWEKAHQLLMQSQLSADELQNHFTEDRWKRWIGYTENPLPFTIGLRIIEPPSGEGDWSLEVVLRSLKNESQTKIYGRHKLPKTWAPHEREIKQEITGWLALVPSLEENGKLKRNLSEAEAWQFLTEGSEKLLFVGATILLPSWWTDIKKSSIRLKAKVSNTASKGKSFVGLNALMDFDWRISMNGAELTEAEFAELVENKRRLIYVNGQWVKLDSELIRHIQTLMKTAEQKGISFSDVFYQELTEEETEEEEDLHEMMKIQFDLNQDLKRLVSSLQKIKEIPTANVPDTLRGELRPYQLQGLSWLLFLRQYGFGACLADDMGLGKTIQVISYLLSIGKNPIQNKALPVTNTSLIVCPTSVLGNWQKELERFAPSLKVGLYYGSQRAKGEEFNRYINDYDVILTSYGMTHIDQEQLSSVCWNSIIIDEAQNIKNAGTKQSRSVRKLKGAHPIALTGTPMENRLSELWAIFDFINKGYLGSLKTFQERFVTSIERDGQTERIKELQTIIQPFLLRRTKKDQDVALNLPDKIEQKEFVPLTPEQASLYEQHIKDTFNKIEKMNGFERKGLILQMIGKLKQLCNHPALYLKEEKIADPTLRSGKLSKLFELVDSVMEQKESCLIFTQYIGMGEMIQQLLETAYGRKVLFLNGSLGKKKRDEMIEGFQNGDFPIFILSLKAGGTGLNLTNANHVIHYDRWWNPAVENQATDRAYRIGQKRFVHVHKLIATGTLEEKIDKMIDQKQKLNDEIISGESWITELNNDELRQLVALEQ
ncbi:MAG: DEAD/DEAH box helicase [Bacillus sp. (in: firmicutes)]